MTNASVYFSSRQFRSAELCVVKLLTLKLTIFRERIEGKIEIFGVESAKYNYLDIIPSACIHPFHNSLCLHIGKTYWRRIVMLRKKYKLTCGGGRA